MSRIGVPTNMETKPKLMFSYSRQQTPFVDRLYDELEDSGYSIWLDYQSLVPAQPWFQQIESGVCGADYVLLIVSKDSIQSKNVEPEWRLALQHKKRIILVILEAFALPAELQGCEWVDFRVNHRKSMRQLKAMLENPPQTVTSPAPQSGFKVPVIVWLALALSIIVLIGSLPAWWTILIPYVLLPLPWKLYKRNYRFSHVSPILLILLPLFLQIVTPIYFMNESNILYGLSNFWNAWHWPTLVTGWLLAGLLYTPAMQRRARPEAARVRFANPLIVAGTRPRSVAFAVDYALEDGQYAEDLRRGLEAFGHRFVTAGEESEAIFVLISTYKKKYKIRS